MILRSSLLIRGANANPVTASLNALMNLSKEVEPGWCFHIEIHIYVISHISTHADNIHEFQSTESRRSKIVKSGCGPSAVRASCGGCLTCRCVRGRASARLWMRVCLCVCIPRGFLWCYRGNWMCDAHQKSPLALGKRSFNPSMPLWKAQPKGRLILSTGKHQTVPCSLHHSLRFLYPAVASEGSPLTWNDMTVHMHGCRRGCRRCSPQFLQLISVDSSLTITRRRLGIWLFSRGADSALGQVLKKVKEGKKQATHGLGNFHHA